MELKVTREKNGVIEYMTAGAGWSPDVIQGKMMAEDIAKATARGLHMAALADKTLTGKRYKYDAV